MVLADSTCVFGRDQYIQYQVELTSDGYFTPEFSEISIDFTPSDQISPPTNAANIKMYIDENKTREIPPEDDLIYWNSSKYPYFQWDEGIDDEGGSGILGYCLYLGTDDTADPGSSQHGVGSSGILENSPVNTVRTPCQFIISTNYITLSDGILSTALQDGETYILKVKAMDAASNTFNGDAVSFVFNQDSSAPDNAGYIVTPQSIFSNVSDMFFSWPVGNQTASTDNHSDILGYQYQINSTDTNGWQGTLSHTTCKLSYIPKAFSTYTLQSDKDFGSIKIGNNIVHFRAINNACIPSPASTYRTGNLSYGGLAPYFGGDDSVTITPSSSEQNLFELSWPQATPAQDRQVSAYYYMINTSPPDTLDTLTSNPSTYIYNGNSTSVDLKALPNVNKGINTVRVVAIDDATTPNYSPSNVISGTFTLNSTNPDNVGNLIASDSSIKAQQQWNVTLTWTAPEYQGAGNLTYQIYRSEDSIDYQVVGTTTGFSYVDNTPLSKQYYYKVYTKDGANALSSGTNTVSITPTGKWTTPPTLESAPAVTNITTQKATISWSTSRAADSKVSYGTASGKYGDVDASSNLQVTSHTITLSNLSAGKRYYYVVKWTDEDGNTGISEEKSFSTDDAPTAKDVKATSIGLDYASIRFTVKGASKVHLYYGKTTSFGGVVELSTSFEETTYNVMLSELDDNTKYYYQINTFDEEDAEYDGTVLDFTTLPRPRISSVKTQQVLGTAQPTLLISWNTNTEVSSIITYYPEGRPSEAKDKVNIEMINGEHRMLIDGLYPQTNYILLVKGTDIAGNQAVSDPIKVTTSSDSRPPQILDLKSEGSSVNSLESTQNTLSQLIVTWNTDEPATSQVEFGEGTGGTYSQKTQEDTNLTNNHLVVISGLTPTKVYHFRAISKDSAGNQALSVDTVTITPKATEQALDLVISNLSQVFSFLGDLD